MAKTKRPTEVIIDAETGEIIEQPYTDEQLAAANAAHVAQLEAQAAAAKAAAENKLAAIGLTPDDLKALLG